MSGHHEELTIASCGRPETILSQHKAHTGDYVFENEWQRFRTKKDRPIELRSVYHECTPGTRKLAVKVVDIFGNDTMTIVEVSVRKNGGRE